ncbi:MAG: HipA domain-containing protein [Betaproteobacteria bacterium]
MSWKGYTFAYLPGQVTAIPAGEIAFLEESTRRIESRFGYGARYLTRSNAIPIDPINLPLSCLPGSEREYVQPEFGALRDDEPDFWGRRVIEARLNLTPDASPESMYLLAAGPHRFGALDFRPKLDSPETASVLPELLRLEYLVEAADRIQEGLPIPESLAEIFGVSSMGGARPKALVTHQGQQYLAKFPAKGDGFNVPVVERAVLELARKAGMDVPDLDLVKLADGRDVMLIRRFDRSAQPHGEFARHHCVSALTMLGKHQNESLGTPYKDISEAIGIYGVNNQVATDRAELYRRIAFSILVSNDDDHLRNHAFIWDAKSQGWRLSPLYDVVPHPQVATERTLHLSIGPRGRHATLDNLFDAHGDFGLLKPHAADILEHVATVVREWKNTFDEYNVPPEEIKKVTSAFRSPKDVGLSIVERTRNKSQV